MLIKSRMKIVRSLKRKRNRLQHAAFIVEGYKSIAELVTAGLQAEDIYVTAGNTVLDHLPAQEISAREMAQISQLTTPPGYLAVFKIPQQREFHLKGRTLALDGINDPGNLGTIIRLADWFGIDQIICSPETVDLYNPKSVQATMASLARIPIYYKNLEETLADCDLPVFYADMDGESIYKNPLPAAAIIIMGSESHGVSANLRNLAKAITIPSYGSKNNTESLNVATATSIITAEWLRVTGT